MKHWPKCHSQATNAKCHACLKLPEIPSRFRKEDVKIDKFCWYLRIHFSVVQMMSFRYHCTNGFTWLFSKILLIWHTSCVCLWQTYTKETHSVSKETSKRIRLCVQRNRAGTSLITPRVCLLHTYTNTYYCFIVTEQGCCSCPNKGVYVHTYKHRWYIHRCMDTCININIYIHTCIWYMHL